MRRILLLLALVAIFTGASVCHSDVEGIFQVGVSKVKSTIELRAEGIAPYHSSFGRTRPVIVGIGENTGAEVTAYVVPYRVLTESGAAEMIACLGSVCSSTSTLLTENSMETSTSPEKVSPFTCDQNAIEPARRNRFKAFESDAQLRQDE